MKLKTFPGGIHPPTFKEFTATKTIKEFPLPSRVVLPLLQHTGAPLSPLVKKGDKVIYSKYSGTEVELDGEEYIIVKQSDILAIME